MKSSIFNIHDVALFITIISCLFFATFQFFSPGKNRVAKWLLILFFICIAVGAGSVLMFWQPAIKIDPMVDGYIIPFILFGSLLFKGPLLYSYVCAVTTPHYRLIPTVFVHLIPIALYFLVLSIASNNAGDFHAQLQSDDGFTQLLTLYEWHSVKTIPLIYAAWSAYQLRMRFKINNNNAPSLSREDQLWLTVLVWGFLLNWIWSLGTHLLGIHLGAQAADGFGIADNYITAALISGLFIYSLVRTNKQLSVNLKSHDLWHEPQAEKLMVDKIIYCMEVEKLFLNPRLNIERMAEHLKAPYRDVSAIINQHFHVNFNEFINLYRINEAKRLLADTQMIHVPINEIYAQAGFNSKSAFHRFFNRLVGIPPSEYRKLSTPPIGTR